MRRRLNVVVFVVLFSLILFAVVLGFRTPAWLSAHAYVSFSMHQSYSLANALTAISQTFPLFLNALISHIHEFPLVYWPLVAMQAFVVLFILGSLSGPVRKIAQNLSSNPHLFRILLFLFLSEISSIGAGLATAKIYHPSLFRYLLPIYFFPILSFFLVIFSISNKSNVLRKMTFIAVPALVTAIFCGSNFMNNWGRYIKIPLEEPYPASVKCIDALVEKYGLKAGLANYWHVRYVRMLSRGGIGMSEITNENGDGDLIFFNTTDNINFLFVNPNSRVLRSYDFIILANLNRDRVFLNVGKPTEIEQCGAFEVAVFSSKADHLRLNNYFKNRFKDFAEVNSGVMRLQ